MDVGAAIKAYHVVWNNPDLWSDILIHLGDFHAMIILFSAIGNYLAVNGFEEMVFQGKLCTTGSIKAVMKGKHYNQCWIIHEAFAECIEQLFMESLIYPISANVEHPSPALEYINDEGVFKYIPQRQSIQSDNLGLT